MDKEFKVWCFTVLALVLFNFSVLCIIGNWTFIVLVAVETCLFKNLFNTVKSIVN